MKIKEPTKEQIKEFWEWCGFQRHFGGEWFYERYKSTNAWWEAPSGRLFKELPPIDLNNFFKYAVPNVMESNQNFIDLQVRRYIAPGYDDFLISYTCEIWSDNGQGSIIRQGNTPALALFWAIWEVIHHAN